MGFPWMYNSSRPLRGLRFGRTEIRLPLTSSFLSCRLIVLMSGSVSRSHDDRTSDDTQHSWLCRNKLANLSTPVGCFPHNWFSSLDLVIRASSMVTFFPSSVNPDNNLSYCDINRDFSMRLRAAFCPSSLICMNSLAIMKCFCKKEGVICRI